VYVVMQAVLLFSGDYNDFIECIRDFLRGGNWTVHPDW